MPAASPAVSIQPSIEHVLRRESRRRIRSLAALLIALPIAGSFVVAQPEPAYAQASRGCDRWHSLTRPPDTIRVLRQRSGRVDTVPFKRYVLVVLAKEWPSYLPQAVVEAGAVAAKQYAWYHTLYTTRSSQGGCFDVKDGTGDQIYRPRNNKPDSDHYRALDATWGVSLRKQGSFFMTAYRRGAKVRCGRDANGNRLYALSAKHCAERHGYGWRQILREYYRNVAFVEGGASASSRQSVMSPAADAPAPANVPAPEAAEAPAPPEAPAAPEAPAPAPPPADAPATPDVNRPDTNAVPDTNASPDQADMPDPSHPLGASTLSEAPEPSGLVTPTTLAGATAHIFPGVHPENVALQHMTSPSSASAPALAPVGDPSAPFGDPPAPVIDRSINEAVPPHRTDSSPLESRVPSDRWMGITIAMLVAVAGVAVLLKRRRTYLR